MARRQEAWTPYGLEAIRIRHLRRRRIFTALIAFGLVGAWSLMFEDTTVRQQEIFANGQRAGGGISIDTPDIAPQENKPVTVALSAGRVTRADTSETVGGSSVTRANTPVVPRAAPYNWSAYLLLYGPYLLVAAAGYFLAKRQTARHEVNYGIYKGAMPLEMITASARNHVLTRKEARGSIFGKRRRDFLPSQLVRVERVEQEDDA